MNVVKEILQCVELTQIPSGDQLLCDIVKTCSLFAIIDWRFRYARLSFDKSFEYVDKLIQKDCVGLHRRCC